VQGKRARLGAAAAFACVFTLAACGGESDEGTIPQDEGSTILEQLEQLEEQVNNGECDEAEATAMSVSEAIAALPDDVDGELRQTLITASSQLVEQTRDPQQCEEPEEPEEPEPDPSGATGAEGVSEDEG